MGRGQREVAVFITLGTYMWGTRSEPGIALGW